MSPNHDRATERPGVAWSLLANLMAVLPLLVALALSEAAPEAYYQVVQEDELLEWATVWAFIAAALVFALAAARQRRAVGLLPWFLTATAVFCLFVAGEEVSWGQRALGYRPPTYFLAENFQQELNLHNVVDTSLRKLGLKAVTLGYGAVLPLLMLVPVLRMWGCRLSVVPSPWTLAPAFLATFITYQEYPLEYSGEVVELMLGLGLLFAGLHAVRRFSEPRRELERPLIGLVVVVLLVGVLGAASAAFSRRQREAAPELLAAVSAETEALGGDFRTLARRNRGHSATRCGLHKRVFSFVEKYDADYLHQGAFAALAAQGMPEQRAEFFIDPWNTPYWIRDECSRRQGRRIIFVYSLGPNRKRESTEWQLRGDDVGAVIFRLER